ncbi:MAG: diguanylate cyclase [Armatimonadetes bacterium]|nr:diguanylate cyclase [Armatimonadota bacterium]
MERHSTTGSSEQPTTDSARAGESDRDTPESGGPRTSVGYSLPAWCVLAAAVLIALAAATRIVSLQRTADRHRQTEVRLLRIEVLIVRLNTLHRYARDIPRPNPQAGYAREDLREQLDAAEQQLCSVRPPGPECARVERACRRYQHVEAAEWAVLAARAAHRAKTPIPVPLGHTPLDAEGRLFQQALEDALVINERGAARANAATDGGTALALVAAALALVWSFRRFGQDRYAAAVLAAEGDILRRSEKRFRALVGNTSDVIAILDTGGVARYLSPAVQRVWGYAQGVLVGQALFSLIAEDERAGVQNVFAEVCARPGVDLMAAAAVKHRNGSWRRCEIVMRNLRAEPEVFGVVITFRDVTALKQGEEALRRANDSLEARVAERTEALAATNADLAAANAGLALVNDELQSEIRGRQALEAERERLLAEALERADHDPLTGLLNHRAFHRRLEEEADRAQREGTSLAVAVIDLDNFKFFNDAYGHLAGDDVLRRVAHALQQCCRGYDTLARFGGDEFALLLPGTGRDEAPGLAERLQDRLAQAGYRPPGHDTPIPLSLSVGVAVFPDDEPTRLGVLEMADARLRRTKTGGGETDEADLLRASLTGTVAGFSMLDALVTAVNNKDRYTRRHSEDVMAYSLEIARELNWDAARQQRLAGAALLHDVGKIGVPDAILRKPGRLTAEEVEAVKHHPEMGAVIVGAVPGLEEMLGAIRHHHESWDGKGYPAGLSGEDIPLTARVMAVADAYSAMTTDRPYREGMAAEKAQAILAAGAGVQWDPQCVEAFLRARQRSGQGSVEIAASAPTA